jgi:hypothetical protein
MVSWLWRDARSADEVWEVVYQCDARSEELPTALSVSTSPTIGCGGLLDEANLERFKIECASLLVVNLGSYKMSYNVL